MQAFTQQEVDMVSGSVSYISSQNIYVRFPSTENIVVGDTLLFNNNGMLEPALVVIQKSSTSCVTNSILSFQPVVGQKIAYKSKPENKQIDAIKPNIVVENKPVNKSLSDSSVKPSGLLENVTGSISASTNSYFSSGESTHHRGMMRLALQAQHIADSKFSFETYMNYRKNIGRESSVNGNKSAYFNVYNLAIKYEPDSSWAISLGRQVNQKFTSVGAVDGIQAEKKWKTFFAGAIAGFRPDIYTYNFNSNLFEYGAYGGSKLKFKNGSHETTVGVMEQLNSGNVDRRFAYGQMAVQYKKTHLFSSVDLDFYQNLNGVTNASPRLTNFFTSIQYRINRYVSMNASYDNRKRILYYNSEKEFVEAWLLDDLARQGAKIGIRLQPIKNMAIGGSYGYRFQKNKLSKSQNINGFISYYNLPFVLGSLTLNYNNNTSNYMKFSSYVLRHGRNLYRDIVYANFYARWVSYNYLGSDNVSLLQQSYFGCDFDFKITKKLRAGIMGEVNNLHNANDFRVNLQVIQRF
jgi:hypothetical protein